MSGHSKWSTIKRQKGVTDAKRGAVFTRIGNQIALAARGGPDPKLNSSLAMAIEKAKAANMPLNNIQRAIDRVSDKNAAQLDEVMYEGYGQGGTAIIVEAATDNKNRTYPDVRHAFTKNGGNIAETGSVAFQFSRKGVITVGFTGDADDALLLALDAGAEDAQQEDDQLIVYTEPKALHATRQALIDSGLDVKHAELHYVPNASVIIDDAETAKKILKLLDALDDLDDVTAVHTNFELAEGLDVE
ncbi:YebC/PmpR family DNA-binding transcriptional regulator [Pedobacter sp.]|nr:YebC/PmpR family DNA-binding transcriptional regulator [Candidatus Saccharibacteria bacterium]